MNALIPLSVFVFLFLSGCCFVANQGNSQPLGQYQASSGTGTQVIINEHLLSDEEKLAFQNFYGVSPAPSNYWYDPISGLYGRVGGPGEGFILPGHAFGPLRQDVSNGNTGVILNGRELTDNEVAYVDSLFDAQWQPGRYWLDAQGNVGFEGSTTPFANLHATGGSSPPGSGTNGQYSGDAGSYYGGETNYATSGGQDWSGGDNFWSGNYGAGNSAGGCTYVSTDSGTATSGCG